ncbi:hypothetical protein JTE90_003727 [Oedothorax gibbosus]|uniref:Presequence protease, mitochondrial n=1 Tax=Oedothorax gibbosus TaxID=931172 RepID=A0AAV6V9V0_9ARAC|nr:hypothetical protein JTE90_003727 [Oedothorax gibbosus]
MTIGITLRKVLKPGFRGWRYLTRLTHSAVQHQYNGYIVKENAAVPELQLQATLLEHRATGAEHLHLGCKDNNNFFGVCFRTPSRDSSGAAHILEHLSLCGSGRFPCRDPFFNMINRSLATFMNAFTGSDQTLYVFSTQNPKDFQNLLSVYLDATFAPSLLEKDFRQEGWRLEHEDPKDKNSPIVFKGVVFNEMKGVFSDPGQFFARHLQRSLFPGTPYQHECGGEPLAIPLLTWQGLRDFHASLYHPANSRFVTYGNLPLESHLEQIESQVLQHFGEGQVSSQLPRVQRWTTPREVTIFNRYDPMAAAPDKQMIVSNSYVLSEIADSHETFALSVLGTLLVDGPNAPFYRRLLESGMGPDYSPCTGFDSSLRESVFSVGLREIAEKDVEEVKHAIESTFDQVVKEGFPENQIKGVLHRVELATKHRTSNFGLNCAMGVSSVWNHGGDPIGAFRVNDHVQRFVQQMADNKSFLQDKVVQYFKSNQHKLTLVMKPVENFEAQLQQREKELLASRVQALTQEDRDRIFQQGLELLEHQKKNDASCLPSLRVEDVSRDVERTPLDFVTIEDVGVQLCEQPTNELLYFRAKLDASSVLDEEILLLPLFASVITQMGAGALDYKQLDEAVQLKTGGLDVALHLSEDPSHPHIFQQSLLLSSYCLEKNVDDMFTFWKDIFTDVRLEDVERLSQLIRLGAAELAQGVSRSGHRYAMRRACATLGPCAHREERAFGLTQIEYMKKLAEMENHKEVLEKLRKLSQVLFNKASLKCALNGTASSLKCGVEGLTKFLNHLESAQHTAKVEPCSSSEISLEAAKTHFVLPLSVNYLGKGIATVPYCHPHFASLKVAAKLLSSKFLHSEIREKGGAYGGGAAISQGGRFMFYSYRDPNVGRTLSSFSEGVQWLLDAQYTDQDIQEAKLGVFGEVDAPVPPGKKGGALFQEGVTDNMRQLLRDNIFACTRQHLVEVTNRYLKDSPRSGTALIGPKTPFTRTEGWTFVENPL